MSAFSQLSQDLRQKIAEYFSDRDSLKFKSLSLTSIQKKAIPEILAGKNCILSAQTAGGKTEAAFWPLMDLIKQKKEKGNPLSVNCIYLSPLTALLNNIEPRIRNYAGFISSKVFKWHGGTSQPARKKAVAKPPEILLTTPESLEVILDSASYPHRLFFEGLQFIVIDEVHYFVDSDRGAQLVSLLERLSRLCTTDLQRIGLSATVGNPGKVLDWFCGSSQRDRAVVHAEQQGGEQKKEERELYLEYFPPSREDENQVDRIFKHITEWGIKKSILFTKSRQSAEAIGSTLEKRLRDEKLGDRLHVHHGSVSQDLREEAERLINKTSQEGKRCIVSTSTLELGIDIGGLETVVQLGEFSSVSSYLQRLGRTGRETGIPQNLLCLTSSQFDFLKNLAILQLGDEADVESYRPSNRNYSLLFQQLLGAIRSHRGINFDDFWDIVRQAYPFSDIRKDEALSMVGYGMQQHYFIKADDLLLIGKVGEKEFSKRHWITIYSTFETPPAVRVVKDNQEIGTLDAWWVYNNELPYVFLLGGKKLRARELDEDHSVLFVQEARDAEPPAWSSSGSLTEKFVAQQMRKILVSNEIPVYIEHNLPSVRCLKNMRRSINPTLFTREGLGFEFLDSNFSKAFVYTFAGDRLNKTLALVIEYYTDFEIKSVNALSFIVISRVYSEEELVDELEKVLLSFTKEELFDLQTPERSFYGIDAEVQKLTKFSKYLPRSLQLKQYFDSVYNFRGLQKWLQKIKREKSPKILQKTTTTGLPRLIEDSLGL